MKILKSNFYNYEKHGKIDKECLELCDSMNAIPGIDTFESCCGHGKHGIWIWFYATENNGIFFLARCIDKRYFRYGNDWVLEVQAGDIMNRQNLPIIFWLHSNVIGDDAYRQATNLVDNMNYHLNHEGFLEYYNININKFKYIENSIDWKEKNL